jgi:hypothetical protein
MERRIVLGVYFNSFTGQDGRPVTLMRLAHMDATPGLDENWDGHLVETMPVQADQIMRVQDGIREIPGLYDLNIRRVATKSRSGGDAARLQIAQAVFVGKVVFQTAELAGVK